jgi:uncharacterized protein YbdZ (MbtH family)
MQDEQEDTRTYAVVVNHEEQYSIWLADRELPDGWTAVGRTGAKAECLAYIEEVWTDMRPLSLRKRMEEWAKNPPPEPAEEPAPPPHPLGKNDLVERLEAPQPIEAAIRPEPSAKGLEEQIGRGFVFVRFVATGTEIGVRVDPSATLASSPGADFGAAKGKVRIRGALVLNYNEVNVVAEIDLSTLAGTGHLEFVRSVE